jgi:hypothetical protein
MQIGLDDDQTKVIENNKLLFIRGLAESIDEGLSLAMPHEMKLMLYKEISLGYRITIDKVVADPKLFETCLEDILGDVGSRYVQTRIIETTEKCFNLEFSTEELTLSQAICELKLKIDLQ